MALTPEERKELLSYLDDSVAENPRFDAWIAGAEFRVSRCYFGKAYIYALSLMVSHRAALADLAAQGASGPVTSRREGDLSVSFGTSGSGTGDLQLTAFGQEYASLLEQYSPRPGVTGGPFIGGTDGGDALQSFV